MSAGECLDDPLPQFGDPRAIEAAGIGSVDAFGHFRRHRTKPPIGLAEIFLECIGLEATLERLVQKGRKLALAHASPNFGDQVVIQAQRDLLFGRHISILP